MSTSGSKIRIAMIPGTIQRVILITPGMMDSPVRHGFSQLLFRSFEGALSILLGDFHIDECLDHPILV